MDEKRYLEIALILFKVNLKKDRERLGGLLNAEKREIGNIAKQIGISREEIKAFFKRLLAEMLDEVE